MATTEQPGTLAPVATDRRARVVAFGTLTLANILWAGTYTAGKIALVDLSPITLNTLRFSLAAIVLAPVLIRQAKQIPRDWRSLLILAQLTVLGFVLNKLFEYLGLALSTASDVALLISTESLFTALLSWLFLREPVTRAGLAALGIGMLGVYLIVERGFVPNLGDPGGSGDGATRIAGDLLVVLSLVLESAYSVRGKRMVNTIPPLLFISATITGSLIAWLPAGAAAIARDGWPHLSGAGWLAVLYMALVATVTGYWLWFRALRTLDVSAAAPTLFIQPLLGAALAIWLLGDTLTWATLLGGACIVASLLLVIRAERSPRAVIVEEPIP